MSDLSDDEFYEALNSEDHLALVIRGHLHIEHWINKFLIANIPLYQKYEKNIDANYERKVYLCCAMGLSEDFRTPLLQVGMLRNKFAHDPRHTLSNNDVTTIYKLLCGEHKNQLKEASKRLFAIFGRDECKFSDASVLNRLNLIFMFLRKKLIQEHSKVMS